jgi:DNA-binding NtrC family response regulator
MTSDLIVIIDDEEMITTSYKIFFKKIGHKNYLIYNNPLEFLDNLNNIKPALVFLDLRMPGLSGEEVLVKLSTTFPETSIVIVSGADDIATAVRCIKNGALDYMVKPLDKDRFHTAMVKGLEIFKVKSELSTIKKSLNSNENNISESFKHIITQNKVMFSIFDYIDAVAKSNAPFLICGETGTGKELVAEAIHKSSDLKGEMIPVNVSALDENMFNDTLFGHVKGSYTGAHTTRKGLLNQANNGTIFLDEIGDLKESSQIKLLRVIQSGEYMPLGSDKPVKTNARIIAATNANLSKKVADGTFRQDLYYRLNTHQVTIPSLKERQDDIKLLISHFYDTQAESMGFEASELPENLLTSLQNYSFPGNVRELQSIISDFAILFSKAKCTQQELKKFLKNHKISFNKSTPSTSDKEFSYKGAFPTLKEMENILIETALDKTKNNQSKASALLGITRQALNKRLHK